MHQNTNSHLNGFEKSQIKNIRTSFEPGEEVEGTVTAIERDSIFLDVNAKGEGIIDRKEVEKNGKLSFSVGARLKAFFVREKNNGELIFTVKISGKKIDDESIENAYHAKIPIEGRVDCECKGGYSVIFGNTKAFCPFSQVDLNRSPDNSLYLGQKFSFLITEYDGENLVVSRRKLLEKELEKDREHLKKTLREGIIIDGTVKRIMEFGVFVDIGGIDGLVPMGELAWGYVKNAEEIVHIGETIAVKVLNIQWDKNRIALSLKYAGDDPWLRVKENYHVTKQYNGTVTKRMNFGAFVALEPGVEGLIHISKLGAGKRLSHASEVLEDGQEISVFIETIDYENRRISLMLENPKEGRTMEIEGDKIIIGQTVPGVVQDIKPFGIFVKLSSTATGLLHTSEISLGNSINTVKSMFKHFPIGSEIQVLIKNVRQNKISLTLPSTNTGNSDEYHQFLAEKKDSDDFGSLGSAFKDIQL